MEAPETSDPIGEVRTVRGCSRAERFRGTHRPWTQPWYPSHPWL